MVPTYPGSISGPIPPSSRRTFCGKTMMQHGPDGMPFALHATLAKRDLARLLDLDGAAVDERFARKWHFVKRARVGTDSERGAFYPPSYDDACGWAIDFRPDAEHVPLSEALNGYDVEGRLLDDLRLISREESLFGGDDGGVDAMEVTALLLSPMQNATVQETAVERISLAVGTRAVDGAPVVVAVQSICAWVTSTKTSTITLVGCQRPTEPSLLLEPSRLGLPPGVFQLRIELTCTLRRGEQLQQEANFHTHAKGETMARIVEVVAGIRVTQSLTQGWYNPMALFSIPLLVRNSQSGPEQKFIDFRAGANPKIMALKSCVEFGGDVACTSSVTSDVLCGSEEGSSSGGYGHGSPRQMEHSYAYCDLDLAAGTPGDAADRAYCHPIQPSCVATWLVSGLWTSITTRPNPSPIPNCLRHRH
jgi:hypothetical protein